MQTVATRLAAHRMREDSVRFAEGDANLDGKLDFEEFLDIQPASLRETHSVHDIRRWFDQVDSDGDGAISLSEFFFWSLSKVVARSTAGQGANVVHAVFQKHDKDGTGFLDSAEFHEACSDLGFGARAHEIFSELDDDQSGFIEYSELIARISKANDATVEWVEAEKAQKKVQLDTSGWVLDAKDADGLAKALRNRLRSAKVSVVDLLHTFNEEQIGEALDGTDSAEVDEEEFIKTMTTRLGYRGKRKLLELVFGSLDLDRSGKIGLAEFFTFILGRQNHLDGSKGMRSRYEISAAMRSSWLDHPMRTAWLHNFEQQQQKKRECDDAEEEEEAADDSNDWSLEQFRVLLRALLASSNLSDIDLLRACDKDGDGSLNKGEFLRCMKRVFVEPNDNHAEGRARERSTYLLTKADQKLELELWDDSARPAVLKAFDYCAGLDLELSCVELASWLATGKVYRFRKSTVSAMTWAAGGSKKHRTEGENLPELSPRNLKSPSGASRPVSRGGLSRGSPSNSRPVSRGGISSFSFASTGSGLMQMSFLASERIKTCGPPILPNGDVMLNIARSEFDAEKRYWEAKVAATRNRIDAVRHVRRKPPSGSLIPRPLIKPTSRATSPNMW